MIGVNIIEYIKIGATTQRGYRLKTVRKNGDTAHFEAMFGERSCCFFNKVLHECFYDRCKPSV